MTPDSPPDPQPLARLLETVTRSDPLDHAGAEALIPDLVEAERAGDDVDREPRFAALLTHLEQCPQCLDLYEQTAEALARFEQAPATPLAPVPPLFDILRRGEHAVVRLVRGLARRFELSLSIPALQPVATGTPRAITLFDATLDELPDTPDLSVTLDVTADTPRLWVAFRTPQPAAWEAILQLDSATYRALPGPDGRAALQGFTQEALQQARIVDLLITPPDL